MSARAEDPVARIERLLGTTWKEKLAGATWRSVEDALHTLGDTKPETAIPALARWLDHPAADVSGTAAEVLLSYDAPAALDALVARLGTAMRYPPVASSGPRYQTHCVLACIKRDPASAFDRLAPLCEPVRRDPTINDPWVIALFRALTVPFTSSKWLRTMGIGDVHPHEPRWLDLAYELAAMSGKDLRLAGPALLLDAGDPRAMRAYARALRVLGVPYLVSFTSYRGVLGAPFLALIGDPEFADIEPALRALAAQLR